MINLNKSNKRGMWWRMRGVKDRNTRKMKVQEEREEIKDEKSDRVHQHKPFIQYRVILHLICACNA